MIFAALLYFAVAITFGYGLSAFMRSPEAAEFMAVVRAGGYEGRIGVYFAFCCLCWPATLVWLASQPVIRETIVNAYREAKAANKADAEKAP